MHEVSFGYSAVLAEGWWKGDEGDSMRTLNISFYKLREIHVYMLRV